MKLGKVLKKKDEPVIGDIFQALGQDHGLNPADPKPTPKADDQPADVKAIMAQLAMLQSQNDELARTNAALTTAIPTTRETPKAPEPVKYDGLPNPIDDPEGYAKALTERITTFATSQQNYTTQVNNDKNSYNTKLKDLWEDFATAHPEIAEETDKAEWAAERAVKAAQKRGLDLDRYMFVNRTQYMKDVVDIYKNTFGEPGEEPAPRETPDPDANRTGGIFGGLESGGRAAPAAPPPGDMIKDMQDIQRKTGFY